MAEPKNHQPYVTERMINIVRSLNVTNVLMIALLLMLAVPSYFAYRFLSDEKFRSEFMGLRATIIDKHVPCVVLEGRGFGRQVRHTILVLYELDGRFEKVIGRRAPGELTDEQIATVCQVILSDAARINQPKEAAPQ